MDFKYKSIILLVLCLTFIGAVSASDISDDNFNLEATDIDEDIGEISTDSVDIDDELQLETNSEETVITDDGNGNSDDPQNDESNTVTTENGGIRNISFSDGYNGYCIDMTLHGAEAGESFSVRDTSVIMSHIYDDTPVGDYLKILFYNYYDEVNSDKEVACEAVWTFTDRYYKDSSNELVQKVIQDYNDGLRVPDHGAVKKINDTHEMVFDFETLISSQETIQNYFAYKTIIREIEQLTDNGTDDNSTEENSTEENSTDETSGDESDSSDDTTDSNDENDESGDKDLVDKESSDSSSDNSGTSKLNHGTQKNISNVVAGNPLLALFIGLILLILVPLRTKK